MCWLESNIPRSYDAIEEKDKVSKLRDEVKLLEEELSKERTANRDIQLGIIGRRKRSDELVAMMTLLRGETEAILQRHNILLDSPEAKQAARELHEENMRNRAKAAEAMPSGGAVNGVDVAVKSNDDSNTPVSKKLSPEGKDKVRTAKDDDENDGDDEGEIGEDENDDEEGEIVEPSKGEWGDGDNIGSKRDLDEGRFGDDLSSPGRKRRKL